MALKVLCLEDTVRDAELIREMIIDSGYDLKMDVTATKKEFDSFLRTRKYDIILSDYKLPGFDAFGALELSKQICPDIPFICVSGSIGEETAIELLKLGAVDYVLKDRPDRLPFAIKRALDEAKEKAARQIAEQLLRESEERYRRFFEEDLSGDYKSLPSGEIIICNKAFANIFGCESVEQVLKMNAADFYLEPSKRAEFLEELKLKGKLEHYESTLRRIDGKIIYAIENVVGKYDVNGQLVEIIGYLFDTTARKKAEESLRKSEDKYRTIFENVQDVFYQTDLNGIIREISPSIQHFSNFSRKSLIGKSVTEIYYDPEDRKQLLDSIIEKGELRDYELRITSDKGELLYASINARLIYNKKGEPDHINGSIRDITERKKAAELVEENENRMRMIVEGTPYLFFYTQDKEAKITYISPSVEKITGHSIEELHNRKDWFITDNKINQLAKERTWAQLRGEIIPGPIIVEVEHADKRPILLELYESPIIRDGEVLGLQGVAQDITERKYAVDQLRKLSRAVEQSPTSIIITDPNGIIEYINSTVIRLTGFHFEEIIGKTPKIFSSGEKPSSEYKILWDTITSGKEWRGEFLNKKKSGELYWENATISPIINEEGATTHYLAIKEDITQSKKDQEEIARMAGILEATPDLVSMADTNGNTFYMNRGGRQLIGLSQSADITKMKISDFHPDETAQLIANEGLPTAAKDGFWHGETRLLANDGEEIPVAQVILCHRNSKNIITHYSTIIKDIRESKKFEETLQEAKERAEQSDKLKSEFLAQMSHEIRSPMHIVLSFANLLRDDLGKDIAPDYLNYLNGIDSAGRRLMRTIELILSASELQVGSYEPTFIEFDLINEVLVNIKNDYTSLAKEKGLELNLYSSQPKVLIKADKWSVDQLFMNLVDNAVKYTLKGFISIHVSLEENDQAIKVIIEDTGIGMTEDFMSRMFKPFTQEDRGYSRRFEGNGLGLSLVKKYCDMNGITIEVESKKEKGTKFTLYCGCKND